MSKIKILDCTLRDGGYYNNWDFSNKLISKYLNSMSSCGVEYVELGFRSFESNTFKGACAYAQDEFLNSLKIPRNLKVAVMINVSELLNYKTKNPLQNIKILFKKNKNSLVKLVRLACHYHEVEKILVVASWLKKQKYKVAINLMQIDQRSDQEIETIGKILKKDFIDILYFADSMGGLETINIGKIINLLKKNWKGDLGIHTHDNMSRAIENTNAAVKAGVKWIDSTVMGMGRGPGNAKTEYIVLQYKDYINRKINLIPLLNTIDQEFKPLKDKYNWGTNPFYFLSGMHGIHPTFIQGMLSDTRFSNEDMLSVIDHLKKIGGQKFNKNLLDIDKRMYYGKCSGTWRPSEKIKNKEVLILGTGPGVENHKKSIENYISKKKPFVIGLNTQKSINENLINIRATCNAFRLLTDRKKYKSIKKPIVLPLKRLPKEIKNYLSSNKLLDFGLQVVPKKFHFSSNYAVVPNSLVISYALAIASSGKASRILLAGFDGYPSDDPRRIEMDEIFNLFQSFNSKTKITSITPTRYKISSTSIYAL